MLLAVLSGFALALIAPWVQRLRHGIGEGDAAHDFIARGGVTWKRSWPCSSGGSMPQVCI